MLSNNCPVFILIRYLSFIRFTPVPPLPNTLHVALTVNRHDEGDSYAFTLYDMARQMVARCAAMVKRKVQLHIQDVDDDTRLRVPSADNYQLRLAAEGGEGQES